MKTKILLAFAASVLLLAACNQGNDPSKWKIKTETNFSSVSFVYYYNAKGDKIATVTSEGDSIYMDYKDNRIESKIMNRKGVVHGTSISFLNSIGKEDSLVNYDVYGIGLSFKNIYDSNGFLIERRRYLRNKLESITRNNVVNGDVVSIKEVGFAKSSDTLMELNPVTQEPELVFVKTDTAPMFYYDFYPNKLNTAEYEEYLLQFHYGSRHLMKTGVQIYHEGSKTDTSNIDYYKYTFDDKQRVISAIMTDKNGWDYDSTVYTYY